MKKKISIHVEHDNLYTNHYHITKMVNAASVDFTFGNYSEKHRGFDWYFNGSLRVGDFISSNWIDEFARNPEWEVTITERKKK